jgi:DNA processing protein
MKKDVEYWISFNKITGLGPVKLYNIWQYFEDLKTAWTADISEFQNVETLSEANIEQIRDFRSTIKPEEELEKIINRKVGVLTLADEDYPDTLKSIHDPPLVLYYRGNYKKEAFEKSIGMVGTRQPSYSGKKVAYKLSYELSELGISVISGLALGIDTECHKGCLKAENSYTVAVLGCGVNIAYPKSNSKLYSEIAEKGLIISEYEPGTPPDAWRFPARNRIISGLAKAVLVIEAGEKSGALITTDFALEQGRDVMATPGDILNNMSKGPNNLIKQGAIVITDVLDIVNAMGFNIVKSSTNISIEPEPQHIENLNLSKPEQEIYLVLNDKPQHLDNILEKVDLPLSDITSNLIMLELKQLIKQLPGKLFIRI